MIRIPEDVAKKIVAYFEEKVNAFPGSENLLSGLEVCDFRNYSAGEKAYTPFGCDTFLQFPQLIFRKARWTPKEDEKYYFATEVGGVDWYLFSDDSTDREKVSNGNCFKTLKEAEKIAAKVRAVTDNALANALAEAHQ